MAIQTTSNLEYNYGTYLEPYFRLVLHLPANGQQTPVDCFMYSSKNAYTEGANSISCLPFYIENIPYQPDNEGEGVVNKYLLYITEQVVTKLEDMFPSSTFEIVGIPTEISE